ncbi:DMT family transporter [Arthrobacter sp. M4]|uniref:EamA family transporter n=1 Tax=Arthrobacter sp. M4 TaxID=218160 RepID=UPI001CDD8A7C|nr:EamA family transporter [Arthrobacter sp. M4]MCA4133884.1 EamA family transporter [Arthrobacter sp. M4]
MSKQKADGAVGVATLMASSLSNQVGAASGSLAFPVMGPVGVVAVRQLIAAAVLLPVVRPRYRSFTRQQLWPVILLAVVFGTMNLTLYAAIERVGLGLAVTLEFLGPLSIALLQGRNVDGGGSRFKRWAGVTCAIAAGIGVISVTQPGASTDYPGIGLGLVAALCWASYILLNRTVGRRIPGVQGTAAATGVSAALFLPVAVVVFATHAPDALSLLYAAGAGVLASVIPYVADLLALRKVPANLFGILMSVNPVYAALIGAFFLGQALNPIQWAGILIIVGVNACAVRLRTSAV